MNTVIDHVYLTETSSNNWSVSLIDTEGKPYAFQFALITPIYELTFPSYGEANKKAFQLAKQYNIKRIIEK